MPIRTELKKSRRVKLFAFNVESFIELFMDGPPLRLSGIPRGAKQVGLEIDVVSQEVIMVVEHDSFDEHEHGSKVDRAIVQVEKLPDQPFGWGDELESEQLKSWMLQAELKKRDEQIAQLEAERDAIESKSDDLHFSRLKAWLIKTNDRLQNEQGLRKSDYTEKTHQLKLMNQILAMTEHIGSPLFVDFSCVA